MIFDGSTYKASGKGFSKEVHQECRLVFSKARNKSVINQLMAMRSLYESKGRYPKTAYLYKELERSIDISAKTIGRIVKEEGASKALAPTKAIPYNPEPAFIPEATNVITKNYHICAW